jgi:hypothetical protein
MLNSTLPFSKARARCWAGTPVSESYLWGGGQAKCSSHGNQASPPREPLLPAPYQWKSSPRPLAGLKKRASRKQSWL